MNRTYILKILVYIVFFFIALSLFYIQVVKGPYYYQLSQENRIRLTPIEAVRGTIFDRVGRVLARDVLAFDLVAMPQELKQKDEVFARVEQVTGIKAEKLRQNYKRGYFAPFAEVVLIRDLSREAAYTLTQMNPDLQGVIVKSRPRRHYTYPEPLSHVLGYLGLINRSQLSKLRPYGYSMADSIGQSGLEKTLDNYIKGEDGGMQIEVDHKGRQRRVLGKKVPVRGKNATLTIDAELCDFIYGLMEERKGACIVAQAQTGEVLALISSPAFDPNSFVDSTAQSLRRRFLKSKDYPLLNRAIQSAYSPGSIFKIVTASAGLESSKINRNTVMDCRGAYALGNREFACWIEEGHGPLDLRHALMGSCNVYFYKLGKMLGEFEIARFAYQFGLGRPTGIDLPGETSGLVPDRRWKRAKTGEQWYEGDTINLAIGQGYLLATPAQALVMVNAVANEGGVITPYIVHSIDTVQMQGPRIKDIGVSKKNLEVVKRGLFMAVDRSAGTGIRARVPGLKVAGKTGTAQAGSGEPHAWFTGYAPADDPKVSLVIFLENGGYAGEEAAPIAGKIFRKLRDMKLL